MKNTYNTKPPGEDDAYDSDDTCATFSSSDPNDDIEGGCPINVPGPLRLEDYLDRLKNIKAAKSARRRNRKLATEKLSPKDKAAAQIKAKADNLAYLAENRRKHAKLGKYVLSRGLTRPGITVRKLVVMLRNDTNPNHKERLEDWVNGLAACDRLLEKQRKKLKKERVRLAAMLREVAENDGADGGVQE